MKTATTINAGDLVKVNKPFFSHKKYNFNINSDYDFGIVVKKMSSDYGQDCVAILLNTNNIIYRHANEVCRI